MSEEECRLVSSRGILRSCKVHCPKPISSFGQIHDLDFSKITPYCTVYICSHLEAIRTFLSKLTKKVILVTGDSDLTITQEIADEVLSNPLIVCWWAQNLMVPSKRLRQIPIGQDYHTMRVWNRWGPIMTPQEQEDLLFSYRSEAKSPKDRLPICYANFHFMLGTTYAQDRTDAIAKIPSECIVYEKTRVTRHTTWKNQTQYAFIISPHGNGYDCHRTWEGLALGCYVIVKTSGLDHLYEGLPVLIVSDWGDINLELLRKTIEEFETRKFNYEKLTLDYWMTQIQNSARQF